MDNFSLDAPVTVLFSGDPIKALDNTEITTTSYELNLNKKHPVGNGYRGYYWKWFDEFKRFYFSEVRENLKLPSPGEFESSFRIAKSLYQNEYLKGVDTVEEFFGVMESIINSSK